MEKAQLERAIVVGCGYVGKAVAAEWVKQGLEVTVTTTTPERIPELDAIAHHAIVLRADDSDALHRALSNHDAVLLSIGAPNRDAYEQTYLNTAKSLASVLSHTSVQHVAYTGSCAIYGDQGGRVVNEETAIAPITPHHHVLATTEQILLGTATPDQPVSVLRLGGIYGPGRSLVRIFGRAAGTTRPGDGAEPSNWTHLDDIVGAIDFSRTRRLSGLYNVVQDKPPSRRELIDLVCQTHSLQAVQWDPQLPSTRSYNAIVSSQKIHAAGYSFIHKTFNPTDI
ncbi:MAG: NAD-dependent epimerase/dehydratase family protein [Cyanobacteria bacterium P01_A01_bin.37]